MAAGAATPTPAMPEEIREMASYLGIKLPEEAYLLFIAKLAVEATLPIGWREERDEAHDRSIFYDADGKIHEEHPNDAHLKELVCVVLFPCIDLTRIRTS